MLKGFKDFIMRGNVVDLAVGIVIGAAFATLVDQFTTSFLTPLINLVTAGSKSLGGGKVALDQAETNVIAYGDFIGAAVGFLLTAAVIYFLVVLPMNKLAERRARTGNGNDSPAAVSEEVRLLREIRDALVSGAEVPAQGKAKLDQLTES